MAKIIKGEASFVPDPSLLEVTRGRSVISRELLLASEEARDLIEKAREEATQIRLQAEAILEEAIREKEEERQRGYEEGREEALASLTERIASMEVEREKILSGQEKEIIGMVLEIVQKIVAREVKRGAVVDVVRQAIAQAVGERLVIRIHPEDRPRLAQADLLQLSGGNRVVTIREEETITPGGCVIETELGSVDARLETQWNAILRALGGNDVRS